MVLNADMGKILWLKNTKSLMHENMGIIWVAGLSISELSKAIRIKRLCNLTKIYRQHQNKENKIIVIKIKRKK